MKKKITKADKKKAQSSFVWLIQIQAMINKLMISKDQNMAFLGPDWMKSLPKKKRAIVNRIIGSDSRDRT